MRALTPADPTVPTDAELVAAYRAGDERAATALVRRHAPQVARFLAASGARPGELDDLVQEALFKAFRALDGWRGEAPFRSWLCTIAANLLRDSWRRGKGRQMVSIEDHDRPDTADPHAELAAQETEARVQAAIAKLPRLQREVFLLRAQQDADYEAIAAALGTTPGAARVHYHHAVKKLKELVR